jgi:hypothetical protein
VFHLLPICAPLLLVCVPDPYPTPAMKHQLCRMSNLTYEQVSGWVSEVDTAHQGMRS